MFFNHYQWTGLNRELFEAINSFRGPIVDTLMIAGTYLGDYKNAACIFFVLSFPILIRRMFPTSVPAAQKNRLEQLLLTFLLGCVLTSSLVMAGKIGFDMPRPEVVLPAGTVTLLVKPSSSFSFPSGHAAFAALVACLFWSYCTIRGRVFFCALVLWVGVSRISVGAHFPVDVLAGYLCGVFSAVVASKIVSGGRAILNRKAKREGLLLS